VAVTDIPGRFWFLMQPSFLSTFGRLSFPQNKGRKK